MRRPSLNSRSTGSSPVLEWPVSAAGAGAPGSCTPPNCSCRDKCDLIHPRTARPLRRRGSVRSNRLVRTSYAIHSSFPRSRSTPRFFDSYRQSDYDLADAICQRLQHLKIASDPYRAPSPAGLLDVRGLGGGAIRCNGCTVVFSGAQDDRAKLMWRSFIAVAVGGMLGC